jgi:hypothetical protein
VLEFVIALKDGTPLLAVQSGIAVIFGNPDLIAGEVENGLKALLTVYYVVPELCTALAFRAPVSLG